jgi:hypothetical protein
MRGILKYSAVMVLSAALSVGLTGCSNPFSNAKSDEVEIAATGDVLYEAGLQFVRLEKRDAPGLVNDHPVVISQDELKAVLQSVYVEKGTVFSDRQLPMFSASEVQILSSTLASGFTRVERDQDLTFVLLGTHASVVSKERMTNSGRIFFSGSRLNIIFGKAHEEFKEIDPLTRQPIDRRLNPLLPGKRTVEAELTTPLVLDEGQSFYIDPETGKERKDWLVIDVPTVLAVAAERGGDATGGQLTPELMEDIARSKQEAANLRKDMANIKEVLFEMSDKLDRVTKELDALKK